MTTEPGPITVLCADDNEQVGEALRLWLGRGGRYAWAGYLTSADRLAQEVARLAPDIVVLDIDMPGLDPFEALAEISGRFPESRVVIFSGHVRLDYVERAVESGAWGYVSKNDGERHLTEAMEKVFAGEFYMSPEANGVFSVTDG